MANLPDESASGESSISDYSESFELDDTSSDSSQDKENVVSGSVNQVTEATSPTVNTKKPPKSKRPHSSDGVNLGRTIRSPIPVAHHLNQDDQLFSDSTIAKPLTFKQAAAKVQGLQSSAKKFNSSNEIREVAFKEWLGKKEVTHVERRNSVLQSKRVDTEEKRKRELELSLRGEKKVEQWTTTKQSQLQRKQKKLLEEAERTAQEEEDRLNKIQEGKEAAKRWREVKDTEFVQKQRGRKKERQQKEQNKSEEREEKRRYSEQAFLSWSGHKDKVIKESVKSRKAEARKLKTSQNEQVTERQKEAKKSFEAWKSTKDERIKNSGLFTYKNQESFHEAPWCPARGIKHNYPKTKQEDKSNVPVKKVDDEDSYSSFFESEPDMESFGESSESSLMDSVSKTASPAAGRHKTIQVCCQTLQYWCTCQDDS